MIYIYPNKEILEKRSTEMENEKKYYSLSRVIHKNDFNDKLLLPIGIDKNNKEYNINLLQKNGILISGETGSGKSIFLHDIIVSLLLKNSPQELQFIFIDPRNVEFNSYNDIPHVFRSVSNKGDSINVLREVNDFIKRRQNILSERNFNNIEENNKNSENKIPHLVLIIDESADIFEETSAKNMIKEILSFGYKCGVHVIVATSSYLKNCFDEQLIDMFDYVLSFDLASEDQAKTLKIKKASWLSVYGEALVKTDNEIINVQVPYVSTNDIEEVVKFLKNTNKLS